MNSGTSRPTISGRAIELSKAVVVEISGHFGGLLDPDPFHDLIRDLFDPLLRKGRLSFVLDLSEVRGLFPDGSHIGSILFTLKRVEEQAGTLRVVLNAKQIEMWEHFNFGDTLPSHRSRDDALEAIDQ